MTGTPAAHPREAEPRTARVVPTFLVIGAPKAGTTSLHHYLRSHPDVFMPATKELEFFSVDEAWARGVSWYLRHFEGAGDAAAVGEASPGYSAYPYYEGVPERIAGVLPDVRLVYLVRHPIERMRSHYQHRYIAGIERRPIAEALLDSFYLDCSRYALQIDRYLEHFPAERLLVVPTERLSSGRSALADVYRFLGVDPGFRSPELDERRNVTEGKQVRRATIGRLRRLPGVRRLAEAVPERLKSPARRVTHVDAPVPDTRIPPDLERELALRLQDDVRRLRRFVGGDLDGWGIA